MSKSLAPIILASLGLILIIVSMTRPLFDWEVSVVTNSFPSTYKVDIFPSPWITRLGQSLDDSAYVFRKISVSDGENDCTNKESFGLNIARSSQDEFLESISLFISEIDPIFTLGGLIEIAFSVVYIWWVALSVEHRTVSDVIPPTLTALILLSLIFCWLVPLLIPLPPIGVLSFSEAHHCQGILTFNANLSRIHYETPTMILIGILAELAAFGIMLRKIIMLSQASS
jgi:hypothetical protein